MRQPREIPEFLRVPWGVRDLIVFALLWVGIQIAAVVVLRVAAFGWAPAQQFLNAAAHGNIEASFALDLLYVGTGFALVARYLRRYHVSWSAVGWRKVNVLRAVGYLAVILGGFIVAANLLLTLVSVLVPGFNPNQAQTNDFTTSTTAHHQLTLIALVLLPPVLEETIFRGFLFPALAKRWGLVWGAVISSVVFGIAHWQANITIYTFVLGLVLCFMYVRLKSIFPGMAVHMLNNYLAFMALSHK